jgi:hypothetical protein
MPVDYAQDGLLVGGFGVAGYRSIKDLQFIGPMRKVTVLAGPNNTGKSNVLRFLRDHYSDTVVSLAKRPADAFSWAEGSSAPLGAGGEKAAFAVCRSLADEPVLEWARSLRSGAESITDEAVSRLFRALEQSQAVRNHALWRTWRREQRNSAPDDSELRAQIAKAFTRSRGSREVSPYLGNQPPQTVLNALEPQVPQGLGTEPVFLPAFRQIRSASEMSWDGAGLIPSLADLRDPDLGPDRHKKEQRWNSFVDFVRTVLQRPDADIRVPATMERLIVMMDGRQLHIEDLGTGIHEVVILAAASTAHEKTLFLVEEPEIHIHPLLQRRLIEYLSSATSNQYVIATHSAHLLDYQTAAVFRVGLRDGWTVITGVDTNTAQIDTARELGYRPSDLLQADSVIWVEGPSDRIYMRYWIEALDPSLVEGIHYSIMFYGGKLAAHVSGVDTKFGLGVGELIELRRLNRKSAIVLDSDRSRKGEPVRATSTKGRLRSEFEVEGGVAWITQGREIENYIDPGVIIRAIRNIDSKASKLIETDDYGRRWRYRRKGSAKHHEADKVQLAREVVALEPSLDVLDLRRRVASIVSLIRS